MKLNSRQWKLYEFLKERSEMCLWTSKEAIYEELNANKIKGGYKKSHATSHDICTAIWSDIDKINMSYEVEKIIISDHKNFYKLAANKIESAVFNESYRTKALKAFKRYWTIEEKANADGQGKLISNQDRVLDEKSRAREFVEAFIKETENVGNKK